MIKGRRLVGRASGAALAAIAGLALYAMPGTVLSAPLGTQARPGTTAATDKAGSATSPPSGETSPLNEVHGAWRVSCLHSGAGTQCLLSQTRPDGTGTGVLAIDLATAAGDGVSGTAVLPFGLDLDAGVMIQVDDQSSIQATRFRTCVPAGCLVPVNLDAATIAAMRAGAILNFHALEDGGEGADASADRPEKRVFAFSLHGVGAALDRVRALAH